MYIKLGGGFDKIFFHPYLGQMIQFESEHIFQTGLVQPEKDKNYDTVDGSEIPNGMVPKTPGKSWEFIPPTSTGASTHQQ